jgi:hypothetical protein
MKEQFELNGVDLDQELGSPGQQAMREVVRSLPEETVSMAWRSSLNTQLHAVAAKKRRLDLFSWVWKPAAGVVVAGALALAFMARTPLVDSPVTTGRGPDVEKGLMNAHLESTASWEVAGDGLTANEVRDGSAGSAAVSNDWEQEDVGATL